MEPRTPDPTRRRGAPSLPARPVRASKRRAHGLGLLLFPFLGLLTFVAFGAPDARAVPEPTQDPRTALGVVPLAERWDARLAEHLWNRAGFGVDGVELERWVAAGPEALVDHLLAERPPARYPFEPIALDDPAWRDLPKPERQARRRAARAADRRLAEDYLNWWVDRMLAGEDPLRERMTLFWHGLFTSSMQKVRAGHLLIDQSQLFRRDALGNYGKLLHEVLRDPAMLVYLDNTSNRRGKPNENLAREVMELFALGEGHYSEADVREAARALTGHGVDDAGRYRFRVKDHDPGEKTVLGVTGHLDAPDLADLLLAQPACPQHVARRLLVEFEGVEPGALRLQRYSRLLVEKGYELRPFLRALFLDPDFYREAVIGAKVLSPLDYLVGTCRRTGLRPPAGVLRRGARSLGMELFDPPSVQGWIGGDDWITTSTLMRRGNLVGLMVGVVDKPALRDGSDLRALVAELRAGAAAAVEPDAMGTGTPGAADPAMGRTVEAGAPDDPVAVEDGAEDVPVDDLSEEELDLAEDELAGSDDGSGPAGVPAASSEMPAGEASAMAPAMAPAMRPADDATLERDLRQRVDAELSQTLTQLNRAGYQPRLGLRTRYLRRGCDTDEAVVRALLADVLAIEPPEETVRLLVRVLGSERDALGLREGAFLRRGGNRAEELLRRLTHLVLSLPEAQLG